MDTRSQTGEALDSLASRAPVQANNNINRGAAVILIVGPLHSRAAALCVCVCARAGVRVRVCMCKQCIQLFVACAQTFCGVRDSVLGS